MFRITPFRVFAFMAVAAGAFLWPSFSWMQQIDECMLSGGAMDYETGLCSVPDAVSDPPPRAWYVRPAKRELIAGSAGVVILAVIFAARDRIDRSNERAT